MPSSGRICPSGEDLAIYFSLIAVEIFYGSMSVVGGNLLSKGVTPFVLMSYSGLATTLALAPFAFAAERYKWPARLSYSLVARIVLLAVGLYGSIGLLFMGMAKTSPPLATAMSNLSPSLIFLIAWCLRWEKVDLMCSYSRAKIIGTLVCLSGAMVMSFLRGPSLSSIFSRLITTMGGHSIGEISYGEWTRGCIYLIIAVSVASFSIILQASTVAIIPAPVTICTLVALVGGIFCILVQLILDGGFLRVTWALSALDIAQISFRGIGMEGVSMAIWTWAMHKRGPVFVSVFNPICTVISAILSSIFLGDAFYLGSLAGVILIFIGLYIVLWAKSNEDNKRAKEDQSETLQRAQTKKSFVEGDNLEASLLGSANVN